MILYDILYGWFMIALLTLIQDKQNTQWPPKRMPPTWTQKEPIGPRSSYLALWPWQSRSRKKHGFSVRWDAPGEIIMEFHRKTEVQSLLDVFLSNVLHRHIIYHHLSICCVDRDKMGQSKYHQYPPIVIPQSMMAVSKNMFLKPTILTIARIIFQ